ncbi:metalloregulator ArsR/SmtB family transcription factor [Salarchaeum sp. JOR-1]|uniref:ArsR/SmtB family transcription factor n=1 Tax=Salarchaeum sp. JOR-1 TaxID=2599399 RepID=UPI0011985397|nr:metalloregulator ArsR/SmtB family transcription factor [Salarchaeum sp. JOR-1]QDX41758.1 winged helix-turn-helix transcriptional regulator [Salarchaeum sp. JOR-1]
MSESERLRRKVDADLGGCCDADVANRLSELRALADDADERAGTRAVFAVLGDETRNRLVRVLAASDDRLCVCELEPLFSVSESALSHALSDLADAGLVTREKEGNWRYYETTERAERLLAAAEADA